MGALIALVGSAARITLRESPDFSDAKRRLNHMLESADKSPDLLEDNPVYTESVSKNLLCIFLGFLWLAILFLFFLRFLWQYIEESIQLY